MGPRELVKTVNEPQAGTVTRCLHEVRTSVYMGQ